MTAQLDRGVVIGDDVVDHRERLRDLHHFTGRDSTTRAVAQLASGGLSFGDAHARLSALGQPWRTLHPLLLHVGNWGSPDGDDSAEDEYTRIGLSPLGRLALDAAASRCGPVPLGLVLGDVHPRRPRTDDPWAALVHEGNGPQRPGFGLGAVLDALQSARSGEVHPSRVLPVPPSRRVPSSTSTCSPCCPGRRCKRG